MSRLPAHLLILPGLIVLGGTAGGQRPAAATIDVASPDGKVTFRLAADAGRLVWRAALDGRPVIDTSPLGVVVNGANLSQGATVGQVERYQIDEKYPWRGVHSAAINRARGARVAAVHAPGGAGFTIDIRAFDDGVAFRFVVPGKADEERTPDAATSFKLPEGSIVWSHDLDRGHYEAQHARKAIAEVKAGEWAGPPLTVRLPRGVGYASITEAGLFRYAGMALQADGDRGYAVRLGHAVPASYPFTLRFKNDVERMARPAAVRGAIATPWRVVMIGRDLNTLVASDIIHNLAPPADPKLFPEGMRTAWVKPGRAVWKYLDGGENTLDEMKSFSRQASALGFEYNVIEGFWQKWTPEELREFVRYSAERKVGIWLWKHSRDLQTPAERRAFFTLCRDAGVAGAKVDFFDHEAKEVIERYEDVLREAAQARVMVNFHGANKPTGESRTWPNELTREAIFGLEYRRAETRAAHDTTVPFTRFLAGHADYTPVIFGAERRKDTTWAHQIATAAVVTSPLLIYGAHPASLLANPAADVIKSIPSVWDETIALPLSEIGEVAVFARRSGGTWFLAVVNGAAARTLRVPLSFLGSARYGAAFVRDRPGTPDAVDVQAGQVTRRDVVDIALAPGGGFVARFVR